MKGSSELPVHIIGTAKPPHRDLAVCLASPKKHL